MNNKKSFYITTPIYYPSDKLHIGHSYTTVAADAMSRFKRLTGYDVKFLTGTDEHGQKIERIAREHGVTPKEYVDNIVKGIKELWDIMDISNDQFIRTTDKQHEEIVQKIFNRLYEQGDIYKSEYEGWYCTPCESFWTKTQMVDNKCPDCDRAVELVKEESYFFKLSKYQDRLIKHIEENPDFLQPQSRQNEMLNNFLRPGLEDLCVSRTSFKWGIPVTFDTKHIIYVWIDALSNYITALGYDTDNDEQFKKYWPADIQLVGKEIVRFHTIIWPIMLMALGLEPPKRVFGHGWLILEGGKMSKSRGNVIDPVILTKRYGVDAIRYFLLREVPFGADGVFSNEALIYRINADLANDLGNLVSRTVAMIDKYFDGEIPPSKDENDIDRDLKQMAKALPQKVEDLMNNLLFSDALSHIWQFIGRTNKYIDETSPWILAKEEQHRNRLGTVLYNLAESIRIIAVLISPFMTRTPAKIYEQLGIEDGGQKTWESIQVFGKLTEGIKVKRGDVIFPRLDIEEELAKNDNESKEQKINENKKVDECIDKSINQITIEDFVKVDLRVATVIHAEVIKGSDKLLKLLLKVGNQEKQVVAGIAEHYKIEQLPGKNLVFVANLKPVKLKGVLSEGMILAASNKEMLSLVTLEKEITDGSKIR